MTIPSPSDLERELVALQALKTPALQKRWREVFGTEPPRKMRAGFLQRAIAYHLQEQVYSGLKAETARELQRLARSLRNDQPRLEQSQPARTPNVPRRLTPGTQLMREWNGNTELVDVIDGGFEWRSKRYRTLSAVAVAITGAKCSGPKFFGLDRPPPRLVKAGHIAARPRVAALERAS